MGKERLERVAARVQEELGRILLTDVRDERLRLASITGVRMTADLQIAHVHYVIVGESDGQRDRDHVAGAFERASGFLRREVGSRLGLRRVPELKFHYDASLRRGSDMEKLLADLRDGGQMGDD